MTHTKKMLNKSIAMLLLFIIGILLVCLLLLHRTGNKLEGFQAPHMAPTELLLINLDSRQDRLKNFMASYNASDCKDKLPLHRMSAVVGKEVDWKHGLLTPAAQKDLEETVRTGIRKGHESLTVGAVGCYLSHLKAMEYIVEKGTPMIVCEDDTVLPPNFYELLQAGLLMLPPEQTVVLLFHVICGGWEKLKCILKSNNFYEIQQFWSNACYYITPAAAKRILEKARPLEVQIDTMMSHMVQQGKLHIYANPIVRTEFALGTDIQLPISHTG